MIKLVEDRVAVVPLENPDRSPGGIIIPEMSKDRLNQGFVKYIGPDVKECFIGQYVLFSGYTGTLVHVKNEGKFIIMPENFIIAELMLGDDELKQIPGLYFREPIPRDRQFNELLDIMKSVLPDLENEQYVQIAQGLARRGVVGPESNPFFTANYELMMEYLAKSFSEDFEWFKKVRVINKRPTLDDIELSTDKRRRPEGVPSI